MFQEKPHIETRMEAIDEIDSAADAVGALSTLSLALGMAGVADARSLSFLSDALDYCGLALKTARERLEEEGAS